jgi:hypothetical protein
MSIMKLAVCILIAAAGAALAVDSPAPSGAPVLEGFGDVRRPIATTQPKAQALFDQGLQQAYAFDEKEAVRAFKAALAADPACAMCAWGVAWQLGPNFNHLRRGDFPEARAYALRARTLLGEGGSPLEHALVEAMITRYGATAQEAVEPPGMEEQIERMCGGTARKGTHLLDAEYAKAMRAVAERYPHDPDVQALYAEAEVIVAPDPGYDLRTLRTAPRLHQLVGHLEPLVREYPRHTGLIHYFIHAADTPGDAARALGAADALVQLVPNSPHLLHMPSHLYMRAGRFADAARVNQLGIDAQARLDASLKQQGFETLTNWNPHNRRYRWFAAQMQGDYPTALAQAREVAASTGDRKDDSAAYLRAGPLLTMVHFGRWKAIAAATDAPDKVAGIAPHFVAHARGLALLKLGRGRQAQPDLDLLASERRDAQAKEQKPRAAVLAMLEAPLLAEAALARHDRKAAIDAAVRGVEAEPLVGGQEPPLWALTPLRVLGDTRLRAGDRSGARDAYREDLRRFPGNRWSLAGLRRAGAS